MTTAQYGSVSSGTLRDADLLSAMLDCLQDLDEKKYDEYVDLLQTDCNISLEDVQDAAQTVCSDLYEVCRDNADRDTLASILNEELPDTLQEFAPAGFYFGAHPGDGSDIGFWMDEGMADCLREYFERKQGSSMPAGQYDVGGRWHPVYDEYRDCCDSVREPSRRYRYSLLNHCKSLTHLATLFDLDVATVKSCYRYCKSNGLLDIV